MAPLTVEAILELANELEAGARQVSLIQALGRLELESKTISKKRGDAKKGALVADKSRDTARLRRKRRPPSPFCSMRPRLPRRRSRAPSSARRARWSSRPVPGAPPTAKLAARAQEDAERARRAYESALGMHERAYEVAKMGSTAFEQKSSRRRRTFSGCWGWLAGCERFLTKMNFEKSTISFSFIFSLLLFPHSAFSSACSSFEGEGLRAPRRIEL